MIIAVSGSYTLVLPRRCPVTSWKKPAPNILIAWLTLGIVNAESPERLLSTTTLFLSSADNPDPRSTMYDCNSSNLICFEINSVHRISARARKLSLLSSCFWMQWKSARSAHWYFFSNGIWPQWPPKISISLATDFRSLAANWSFCSCSFWKALPEHPRINLVMSSEIFSLGHAVARSSTFWT